MKKLPIVVLAALLATLLAGVVAKNPLRTETSSAFDLAGDQADSVRFQLLTYDDPPGETPNLNGDLVYCGVGPRSEPFILDIALNNPPAMIDVGVPSPSHEGAGFFDLDLQGSRLGTDLSSAVEYRVPRNDSFSFGLTLGGVPGRDQLAQISTQAKGDQSAGGGAFAGFATVRARGDAVDPFSGDGRADNYCVSIGPKAEFREGTISTNRPVPNYWVLDGNGVDGGVLVGMEHHCPGGGCGP
jgi:hypothetical protein